jgi:hypothetical protein
MVPSTIRSLMALPLFVALASATYRTVTITEVSKLYETTTATVTSCYTTTVSGEPTTITDVYTTTDVVTSLCTETITTTLEHWNTKTDTEYQTVEGPTETVYAPTETVYKPTTEVEYATETVYKPTTEVEYATETVYKPTTEVETETCTETILKPTTVYIKKYHTSTTTELVPTTCYETLIYTTTDYDQVVQTVTKYKYKYKTNIGYETVTEKQPVPTTIYKNSYETNYETVTHYITSIDKDTKYIHKTEYVTINEVHKYTVTDVQQYTKTDVEKYTQTVTEKSAYPVCTDVLTVITTTLVTLPIFVPTATTYIYEEVYESYHVDGAGHTVSYTTTDTSVSVTQTTRPPQTTDYEPGYTTVQPAPKNPCATVTSIITLIYEPEVATQVQYRQTYATTVKEAPTETYVAPAVTSTYVPPPVTYVAPVETSTYVPPPVTYVAPPVTYTPPPSTTYTPPPSPTYTPPPAATDAATRFSIGSGALVAAALAFIVMF